MRHGKKFNHLGRTSTHRKAMLSNMASSLIVNKRITTTVAKAKALRQYVEPLITRSKTDTTQSRRVVFSYLQDKESSQVLFSEVAEKVADRPGGYTRIIKLGSRLGDNAEMALIELVDFNEIYSQKEEKATRTRRSRRGGGSKKGSAGAEKKGTEASASQEEAPVADSVASEQILETAPAPEEDTPVVEVETKDDGDTVAVSGEAVVGEPVALEETSEAEHKDEAAEDNSDTDTSESEEEPKQ